jgi:hypothetical protein
MRTFRSALLGAALLGSLACNNFLQVDYQNNPDRNKLLGTANDVENFIGSAYSTAHSGTIGGATVGAGGGNDALQPQLFTMGLENVSSLANFAMGPRGAIPRNQIDNSRGSQGNLGNYRDYSVEHRAARIATIGLHALQTVTLGSPGRNDRARAFALFVQGVAEGNLALAYDSASTLTENDGPQDIIPLSGYAQVMTAALGLLDSAIAIATADPAGFPLPTTWINGNALTAAQFIQLARSYKALFRANVARTPAERAAADWNAVFADATAGITSDLSIAMQPPPAGAWDVVWVVQAFATGSANWHQMSQFILGMADTSGGYDAWLATPRASRIAFLVVTPDLRLPQGTTRPAQVGDTLRAGFRTFSGLPYVRNRPVGEDQPGDPFGISMYDFYRSRAFFGATRIGPYPVMTAAQIRLLAAEAQIRLGNVAAAATLIDVSRVGKGGLPSLATAGIADTLAAVPGGQGCVPKVPNPATSFTSSKCGTIWDALKWEYRIETAYTGYGNWYFASRGWGDLPQGTALQWPVPYQEMDARGESFYGLGGVGLPGGAAAGNYGLFAGGVY